MQNMSQRSYGQKHWLLLCSFEVETRAKLYLLILTHSTSGNIPFLLRLIQESLAVSVGMLCRSKFYKNLILVADLQLLFVMLEK